MASAAKSVGVSKKTRRRGRQPTVDVMMQWRSAVDSIVEYVQIKFNLISKILLVLVLSASLFSLRFYK